MLHPTDVDVAATIGLAQAVDYAEVAQRQPDAFEHRQEHLVAQEHTESHVAKYASVAKLDRTLHGHFHLP